MPNCATTVSVLSHVGFIIYLITLKVCGKFGRFGFGFRPSVNIIDIFALSALNFKHCTNIMKELNDVTLPNSNPIDGKRRKKKQTHGQRSLQNKNEKISAVNCERFKRLDGFALCAHFIRRSRFKNLLTVNQITFSQQVIRDLLFVQLLLIERIKE